jgi:hypothetical protein
MDDSFSRLASKIRQDKINKRQIRKIKREIIDEKVFNIIKNDMAIKIQSHIRKYLYRKKYFILLDEINTDTIIDYLYLKKIQRIEADCKNIISKHMTNYLTKIRDEKEKINKHKIQCIDLIKAHLKGITFRKRFSKELSSLKDIKDKIERYILGHKVKLILRSNNIQSLLIDIANIKYSLNNIDKNDGMNNHKIKELKTKLTKSINLFYFTFYQMKENSNWISQTKIKEPWMEKYMSIINKDNDNENDNNIFVKKQSAKSIYSNQKKIRRLKEYKINDNGNNGNNKKDNFRNIDNNSSNNLYAYDKDSTMNEREIPNIDNINMYKENKENNSNNTSDNYNNNNNIYPNDYNKNDKKYDLKFYDSESDDDLYGNKSGRKILHKGTGEFRNKNRINDDLVIKSKTLKDDNPDLEEKENINDERYIRGRNTVTQRYRAKKSDVGQRFSDNHFKSLKSFDDKELNNRGEDYDDYVDKKGRSSVKKYKNISTERNIKSRKLNKYEQREERPIKPLANHNFLEAENPFGLKRESNDDTTEQYEDKYPTAKKKSIEKRILNSTRAINRTLINYNNKSGNKKQNISEIEKEETTIKTQEKTDLSLNELPATNKYEEYDNRPCGGGAKMNAIYEQPEEKLDRNERPLLGGKKIDYNAMFGEGGEEFEGDPFGGAKQYESNKDRVKNVHRNNAIKKKPVYDARKAIEEAKLKEAKEGKKEKPSAFREFLREMKKITAEEKAQHNETNADSIKKEKKSKNKNRKNEKKDNNFEYNTENNIITNKNLDKSDTQDRMSRRVRREDKKRFTNIENEEKEEIINVGANIEEKDNNNIKK